VRTLSLMCLLVASLPVTAQPLRLQDGDRVVWLGSTLIEREQLSAWWETALITRFPGQQILFRNLGWSGDTVFGHARAGFGSVADGFRQLKEHTLSLQPTVLLIAYGTNEAFAGPSGLPEFRKGLDTLLDTLAATKARLILFGPPRQGDMGRPLPDPTQNNRHFRLYADAIRETAQKRSLTYIDLYDLLGDPAAVRPAITDNGLHLNERGYRWSAPRLADALCGPSEEIAVAIKNPSGEAYTLPRLPLGPITFRCAGLKQGKFALHLDGKPVATASAADWAKGVAVEAGPDVEQREKLRQAIIARNELYFHRWRPQNVTYLFGFRKHEQGQNAREIPQFDPLVAAREKEIATLSRPVQHRCAFVAVP
jgi:lysophospholipase L1-like esterase